MSVALLAPGTARAAVAEDATRNARFDRVIATYYGGAWGVELGVYSNGRPMYVHGYGLRDRGLPDKFNGSNFWRIEQPDKLLHLARGEFAPDALSAFDLGSVSKEFTAGAILLLQQDGKLSVDDPLSKFFPMFPRGGSIPLLYLLQQRSGLVDYNNFGGQVDFTKAYDAFLASGQRDYTPIVDRLATYPLLFKPGTQYYYSNTNYLLLGLIVAKVSGVPLGAFLQRRILGPLGMQHTRQGYPAQPVTDLALGYENDYGPIYRSWQWNLNWLAGCGGLTSTVGDVELWDRAVRAPGIFSRESLRQMFTKSPIHEPFGSYADGWVISSLDGHLYIWHNGAVGGFRTMNATFPNDGIEIVVLTNYGNGNDPYSAIPSLFKIALSERASERGFERFSLKQTSPAEGSQGHERFVPR
ncbi:MAG: beta-lactamase family protein [Candidatus Eremiobacteraeota bacterium]|nr:beta-lactamase family protein [Candidatus Eremiobacteraeota bacterium]